MQVSWLGSKQSNEIIIFIIIWTEKFYSMIYDLILVNIWKKLFFGVLSFLENEISVKILWNVARSAASPPCSHGVLGANTELQIIHNTIHRSQTFFWIFLGCKIVCAERFSDIPGALSPPQAKISEDLVAWK